MKANNIYESRIADDPPPPTFWGDIRNFFTGLPDRWSQDTGLAHIDRPAERHKNITEQEGLPTLWGFMRSFFVNPSDDDYGSDKNVLGLGWPFSTDINGFSKSDDD
ncbi:hypothetical protein [Acidithiobacillus ferriphilus]|uniref:hypothetical protein n=1 Tax=Acidithiobacillus ferriphilus TaxID=1689834 RepID=UPI001C072553|nr:hypothetical protein [Acidithiobacillus ferriphilus]MBU2854572.1 hypothetical protein [Acidithiobacillus ferriphilus]